MIPVPETAIQLLDFNGRGDKYRDLLQAESDFINDNKNVIYSKARKIYKNVVHIKIPFFSNISCNFELLEQKLKEYVGYAITEDVSSEYEITKDESVEDIINKLTDEMLKHVADMEFEKAAELRDKIKELEKLL